MCGIVSRTAGRHADAKAHLQEKSAMTRFTVFGGAFMALASCAGGEPLPENQAEIPFLSRATVRDWHALDDKTLYIQHTNRTWYRADMFGPCMGLPYATGIGFVNERGRNAFNRFGEIVVDGRRCKVNSLMEAPPPPEATAEGREAHRVVPDETPR